MPDRPWTDEYTLLCEKCGYVIEGLDPSGNCPECGKPIAESLPERRVGTPWQRLPSASSLALTWWFTMRHPLRSLDLLRVESPQNTSWLRRWTIATASFLLATTFVLHPVLFDSVPFDPFILFNLITIPIWMILPYLVLTALTWIETRGLVIIAKTRGFRVDPMLSKSITSNASTGWLLMAVLFIILYSFGGLIIHINTTYPERVPEALTTEDRVMQYAQVFGRNTPQWAYWVDRTLWSSGLLIGFLFFETFAYLGLRRLRFANRVRPPTASEGATTRVAEES